MTGSETLFINFASCPHFTIVASTATFAEILAQFHTPSATDCEFQDFAQVSRTLTDSGACPRCRNLSPSSDTMTGNLKVSVNDLKDLCKEIFELVKSWGNNYHSLTFSQRAVTVSNEEARVAHEQFGIVSTPIQTDSFWYPIFEIWKCAEEAGLLLSSPSTLTTTRVEGVVKFLSLARAHLPAAARNLRELEKAGDAVLAGKNKAWGHCQSQQGENKPRSKSKGKKRSRSMSQKRDWDGDGLPSRSRMAVMIAWQRWVGRFDGLPLTVLAWSDGDESMDEEL